MMPIACMLIKNSGGGGGGAVNFGNDFVFSYVIDPANASCGWTISATGNVVGTGIATYPWLISGANSDYEARATLVSGSLTSGTMGTWILLNTSPNWLLQRNVVGTNNAIVDFECRRVSDSVVIQSWTVSFEAVVDI